MNHYHIGIVVTSDDVKVIKEELNDFLESSGGLIIRLNGENDVPMSKELEEAIGHIFLRLIVTINHGTFQGVH